MNKEQIEKMQTITKELTKLSMLFTHNIDINDALLLVWFEILEEYKPEQISAGFKIVAKTCKGFPTPAHVIEAIKEIGFDYPSPESAFQEAFKKCSSLSWGDSAPSYSSPAIYKAVQEIGGCMRFSELTHQELPFFKKRFLSTYKEIIEAKDFTLNQTVIGKPAEVTNILKLSEGKNHG